MMQVVKHGQSHQKHWFTNNAKLNVKVELTVTLKMITQTASHSYFLFLFKTWSSLKVFIIYDLSKTN